MPKLLNLFYVAILIYDSKIFPIFCILVLFHSGYVDLIKFPFNEISLQLCNLVNPPLSFQCSVKLLPSYFNPFSILSDSFFFLYLPWLCLYVMLFLLVFTNMPYFLLCLMFLVSAEQGIGKNWELVGGSGSYLFPGSNDVCFNEAQLSYQLILVQTILEVIRAGFSFLLMEFQISLPSMSTSVSQTISYWWL